MRIAILSSLFAPFTLGGAEQVAAQMAETMAELGHDVDVISTCRRRDLKGALYTVDAWKGLRVWRIAPWNLYWRFDRELQNPGRLKRALWHAVDLWNPSVSKPLSAVLERIRPDVVNTHTIDGFSPLVWPVIKNQGSTVVHTLHDYHLVCPRAIMQQANGSFCESLCRGCELYAGYHQRFQKSVASIISPSLEIADVHQSVGWVQPRMVHVPNAVNAEPFSASHEKQTALQVVFMSRLVAEKGCEMFLRTVEQFRDNPNIQFHAAGAGPYAERIGEVAGKSPNLTWHGYVSGAAKAALLSKGDVFLQLSQWRENAPLGLLEARHYGLYLIGTKLGGIPEIIRDDSEGCLIAPSDDGSLRQALELQVLARDALRSQQSSRASRSRGYNVQQMGRRYVDVLMQAKGTVSREVQSVGI